jgi:hypothetical protein
MTSCYDAKGEAYVNGDDYWLTEEFVQLIKSEVSSEITFKIPTFKCVFNWNWENKFAVVMIRVHGPEGPYQRIYFRKVPGCHQ